MDHRIGIYPEYSFQIPARLEQRLASQHLDPVGTYLRHVGIVIFVAVSTTIVSVQSFKLWKRFQGTASVVLQNSKVSLTHHMLQTRQKRVWIRTTLNGMVFPSPRKALRTAYPTLTPMHARNRPSKGLTDCLSQPPDARPNPALERPYGLPSTSYPDARPKPALKRPYGLHISAPRCTPEPDPQKALRTAYPSPNP